MLVSLTFDSLRSDMRDNIRMAHKFHPKSESDRMLLDGLAMELDGLISILNMVSARNTEIYNGMLSLGVFS